MEGVERTAGCNFFIVISRSGKDDLCALLLIQRLVYFYNVHFLVAFDSNHEEEIQSVQTELNKFLPRLPQYHRISCSEKNLADYFRYYNVLACICLTSLECVDRSANYPSLLPPLYCVGQKSEPAIAVREWWMTHSKVFELDSAVAFNHISTVDFNQKWKLLELYPNHSENVLFSTLLSLISVPEEFSYGVYLEDWMDLIGANGATKWSEMHETQAQKVHEKCVRQRILAEKMFVIIMLLFVSEKSELIHGYLWKAVFPSMNTACEKFLVNIQTMFHEELDVALLRAITGGPTTTSFPDEIPFLKLKKDEY